jgi:hypothetical protein
VTLRVSLDADWQARLDPADVGLSEAWQAADVPFDRRLTVPGAWQTADPDLARYAGVIWYRTTLQLPADWPLDACIAVSFGAVDYRATVFLDGVLVGDHEGGYDPFEVELATIHGGEEHILVVRVEDPSADPDRPHGKQGGIWYTPTSGPWQSVALVARPRERIARVACTADIASSVIRVRAVCSIERAQIARLIALDSSGRRLTLVDVDVDPDRPDLDLRLTLPDVRPWELHDPYLYRVEATLANRPTEAATSIRVGMRSIETRSGEFFLNGHRQEIRGALDQAFWPSTLYRPPSSAAITAEIRRAKALGFTLLRKHVKPEDPRVLDAADELGILIWAEPPNPDRFTLASHRALRRDLLAMIERDFNHPSIVVWGCYNEDWGIEHLWSQPDRITALASLVAEVRQLDPTRLVVDNSGWAHVATDINDYHEYFSLPEQALALEARLDEVLDLSSDNFADGRWAAGEPVVISEFGAWMLTDPGQIRSRNDGAEPTWFDHAGGYQRSPGEDGPPDEDPLPEIATIRGFETRLAAAGLDVVFPSPADAARHAQRRGARSAAAQVDAFRARSAIAGYVVTELTDTEWEANGWLDAWREPKVGFDRLAAANAGRGIVALPMVRYGSPGAIIDLTVTLINDTPEPVVGMLVAALEGGETECVHDDVIVSAYNRCDGIGASVALPAGPSAPVDLDLRWEADGRVVARTTVELARVAPSDRKLRAVATTGPSLPRILRQRLERHGYRMPRAWDPDAELALVDRLDDRALAFARDGGRVVVLAGDARPGIDRAGLRYRELDRGESWRMHTGVAWARADLLAPAPVRVDLGWESVGIFPRRLVEASSLLPGDLQLAGWWEGWGAFAGSFAIGREVAAGRVLVTTFRFADTFGVDPVATVLLDRLVELTGSPFPTCRRGPGWPNAR